MLGVSHKAYECKEGLLYQCALFIMRMSKEVLGMGLTKRLLSELETSILSQQVHLQRKDIRALNTDIIFYIKVSHCGGERNTSSL